MKRIRKEDMREFLKQRKERKATRMAAKKEKRENSKAWKTFQNVCTWMNRFSLLMHALLSVVIYFAIEAISRHSIAKAWSYMIASPWTFLFNTYMIFATFLIVYIVRRRFFARLIISILWLVLGIVNGYMLSVRVTPFNAQDLKMVFDVVTMIDKYFSGVQGILIGCGIIVLIVLLVYIFVHGGQYHGKMHRIPAAIVAALGIASIIPLTQFAINNRVVSDYFGNIAFAYEDYGLPYCFSASLFNTGIKQSSNYTEDVIQEINKDGMLTEVSATREEMPNIILIQLESFFDPYDVEFFTTSEDPIPTFRYLMENYSSGYFKVPSVGAGTANTEFEVLTGMNLRYFGPGEYPYKTTLKYEENQTESIASALKAFGYGAHALHNNGGNFYSRADVFANLGFDSYTSKEFMNILQLTENGWA
ncbi:MAG: sulfatase-like hydrolase/transferase, partial [Lachnospiraceae bacterium]|nr:sulfatase-like hydrolase/transferase [Lachnospiraceae bacterium]